MIQQHSAEPHEGVADRPIVKPLVDIFENPDELLLVVDLPGVSAQAIGIDIDKDVLTITAKRDGKPVNGHGQPGSAGPSGLGHRLLAGEVASWDYKRVFTVPNTVDAERVQATYTAGVLEVHLPRHEKTKPRRIPIGG